MAAVIAIRRHVLLFVSFAWPAPSQTTTSSVLLTAPTSTSLPTAPTSTSLIPPGATAAQPTSTTQLPGTTNPCLVSTVTITASAAETQSMTNANFWLHTSANITSAGCTINEENGGTSMTCQQPVCVVDYRYLMAGLFATQDTSYTISGGEGSSTTQLATGMTGPSTTEPTEATTPAPGTLAKPSSTSSEYPIYPFETACATPCAATGSDTWTFFKPGVFQTGSVVHSSLNVASTLQYTNFPYYPATEEAVRQALALAYGVEKVQVALSNWTQSTPAANTNATSYSAIYTIWSFSELPPLSPGSSLEVQTAEQKAVGMAGQYVQSEANRIITLSKEYSNNPSQFASFFAMAMPAGTALQQTVTSTVEITSKLQGAAADTAFPPFTFGGSPTVPITAPTGLTGAIEPVFQVVSTIQIQTPSAAERAKLTNDAGQRILQEAFAAYAHTDASNVFLDQISLNPTTGATSARLRRLQAAPDPSGAFNVKMAVEAPNMNTVMMVRQTLISGAYSTPGLGGSAARLLGNLTQVAQKYQPTQITNAFPLPESVYQRLTIPPVSLSKTTQAPSIPGTPGAAGAPQAPSEPAPAPSSTFSTITTQPITAGNTWVYVQDISFFSTGDTVKVASAVATETKQILSIQDQNGNEVARRLASTATSRRLGAGGRLTVDSQWANSYPQGATVTKVRDGTEESGSNWNILWWILGVLLCLGISVGVFFCIRASMKKKSGASKSTRSARPIEEEEELAPLRAQEVQPPHESQARPPLDAFDAMDSNHDGQIDRQEFERAMAAKEQMRGAQRSFNAIEQQAGIRPPNLADSLVQLQPPSTQAPPAGYAPQIGQSFVPQPQLPTQWAMPTPTAVMAPPGVQTAMVPTTTALPAVQTAMALPAVQTTTALPAVQSYPGVYSNVPQVQYR